MNDVRAALAAREERERIALEKAAMLTENIAQRDEQEKAAAFALKAATVDHMIDRAHRTGREDADRLEKALRPAPTSDPTVNTPVDPITMEPVTTKEDQR